MSNYFVYSLIASFIDLTVTDRVSFKKSAWHKIEMGEAFAMDLDGPSCSKPQAASII